ncbi:MAG: transcription elongation factor GreA [bacterium]|nr:transcription elongation factor GreA [bacterium]
MTSKNVEYLTKEKHKELEEELKQAKTIKRREIAEALEFAKSLGDLSENAEYQQAREAQAELEDRILVVEDILKRAMIVSEKGDVRNSSVVSMGSMVTIKKGDGVMKKCQIVGSEESDVVNDKISNECPLGLAIVGRKVGDKFVVNTPKGNVNYTVVSID